MRNGYFALRGSSKDQEALKRATLANMDTLASRGYFTAAEMDHLHRLQAIVGAKWFYGWEPLCDYCTVEHLDRWPSAQAHSRKCPCWEPE